jgi:hypothetical protein
VRELYSSTTTGRLQFKILAPSLDKVSTSRLRGTVDSDVHSNLLSQVQLLRGNALRESGPVTQLLPDGRHCQAIDPQSWHILLQNEEGRVVGCSRYRLVQGGFEQLSACQSSLAHSRRFGPILRRTLERQLTWVRRMNLHYGEAGAWVLQPEVRRSTAAVNIALMTFALAERLGSGVAITTATIRHHSSLMLRRLGGEALAELPAYYEPKFGCVMEILKFDLASLHSQFKERMARFGKQLEEAEIVCAASSGERYPAKPATPYHVPAHPVENPAVYAY